MNVERARLVRLHGEDDRDVLKFDLEAAIAARDAYKSEAASHREALAKLDAVRIAERARLSDALLACEVDCSALAGNTVAKPVAAARRALQMDIGPLEWLQKERDAAQLAERDRCARIAEARREKHRADWTPSNPDAQQRANAACRCDEADKIAAEIRGDNRAGADPRRT